MTATWVCGMSFAGCHPADCTFREARTTALFRLHPNRFYPNRFHPNRELDASVDAVFGQVRGEIPGVPTTPDLRHSGRGLRDGSTYGIPTVNVEQIR